jgi:hypothetical protein
MNAGDDSLRLSASIRASVIDLIDAVADEQPLLLLVEDVHWIDSASLSLLQMVAGAVQRSVLLICTSRVRAQDPGWSAADSFVREELPALEPADSRAHTVNYLAKLQRNADDRFLDWCVDTSGGNPYFIEELVNYWIATGERYSAPPSLVALTEARLACLSANALRVIQAAAILGKNSTLDLLQEVLGFPTHLLFSAIEELGDAGLLSACGPNEEISAGPVLCRHHLIMRVATRALSPQGRALLHHAAARALESAATNTHSAELLWDSADHWQAAGRSDRSTRVVVACARHLHDMGLVHESIRCCESALKTCQNDATRTHVLRALAQSQYAARDWLSFCTTASEVRALERALNTPLQMHDDLELCELNAERNLHRDWRTALDRTLHCVRSVGADASHRTQAAINALKLATNIGDLEIMDAVYREAHAFSSADDVRSQDRLMLTMIYDTIRGDGNISAMAARELLAVAERTLPVCHSLTIMVNCANALRRGGMPGESEDVCEAIFDTAVSLQCFDLAAEACNQLIEMHTDAGQMERAGEWMLNYRRLRRPRIELKSHRSLRISMARVHIWRGQWEAANRLMDLPNSAPLLDDSVTMLRSGALSTQIRLEIGRGARPHDVSGWVSALAPLNARLRTIGTQDYESYSLYLGTCYVGESSNAEQVLRAYVARDRRDNRPLSPEIAAELTRLDLRL